MAVNTKFLANPAWGLQSVVGQALTLTVNMEDFDNDGIYDGYGHVYFDTALYGGTKQGLVNVTPGCNYTDGYGTPVSPVLFFTNFVAKNPIHVKKMNVRAVSAGELPTSIEVRTPNVFTGQLDRQIVNVTADSNMYQNQANIVTLDCDIILARESVIIFNTGAIASAANNALNIDMTFDKYLSVEKALHENLQLLATESGQANAIAQEVQQINTIAAAKVPVLQEAQVIPISGADNTGAAAAVSVQPARTKGFWY